MKINYALILATLVSTSVLAQGTNPAPAPATPTAAPADVAAPPLPPDSTTPPAKAKKAAKKKTVKKKTAPAAAAAPVPAPSAPLMSGQTAEAKQDNINVRGQAHINSEVVGHLKKGEIVTVLEEITLPHPKTDEPAHWAKISLPESMHVWVNTAYLDAGTSTVKANKLNLRTGPGENYSVIGLLHKGDAVKTAKTKGDWTELEPPAGSFAFVAAHLLQPKEAAPIPQIAQQPPPTPTPVVVPSTRVVVETPGGIASAPPTEGSGANNLVTPAPIPAPIPAPQPPQSDEPAPKRVVEREGIVGGTVSIQAPSHYSLKSLDNGRTMDYIYTSSTNVVLSAYKGRTVLVTGEEELDERWPNTPVITIQKIQLVK